MAIKIDEQTVIDDNRVLRINSGSTLPSSPTVGTIFFDSSDGFLKCWNGSNWIEPPSSDPLPGQPSLFAWGGNFSGQLGTGNLTDRSSPVPVVGEITDWVQISAKFSHTVALRANGTAWTWGQNVSGSLGTNDNNGRSSPVPVVGGITDWVQVSGGGPGSYNVALRANGTAWTWGGNNSGVLGTGDRIARSSPVSVIGGFNDWVQVASGGFRIVAIRTNGTAWAWGTNSSGQLGIGNTISRSSPTSVVGAISDWVQVAAGNNHTVALRANGTAWAWGYNGNVGRLGTGNTINRSSPTSVVGAINNWVQVAAGNNHTVALRANGTAWAWGLNEDDQLGTGNTINRSSPTLVVGGITDWVQVNGGNTHTVALRANGTAWAWGFNQFGRLGTGNTTSHNSPVLVAGGFSDWVQVSAGDAHTVAIRMPSN